MPIHPSVPAPKTFATSTTPGTADSTRGRRRYIGEILVAQGVISQEQLAEALAQQKTMKGVRLGRLLVDLGHVTEMSLADAVADQLKLGTVDVAKAKISPEALKKLPRDLALKHRVLPWMIEGRELYLITADPTDMNTLDAIGFKTGMRIKPMVAGESDLADALDRHYGEGETSQLSAESLTLTDQLAIVDEAEEAVEGSEDELERAAQTGPVIKLVNSIIADAIRLGASDIHIEPQQKGVSLRYRVDGTLRQILTMPKRSQAKVVSRIKIAAHMDIAERRKPQDGRTRIVMTGTAYDLRVSTMPTADGEKVVIRILAQDRSNLSFEDLGFETDVLQQFKTLLRRPQGLLLVTGPTGSGKTSTLYAALNFLKDESTNIVTIEDPVEYRLPGINQIAVSDRAGLTFALGLRSILRQDPNIVMVGEIRDHETAQVAFQAAQTGHLVLSTLHTNDAAGTVTRLVEMGIPAYVVVSSLTGVLSQRLVRRLCSCRAGGAAAVTDCEHCGGIGYRGRLAVHELLTVTPRVRRAVMSSADGDDVRSAARATGMRSMYQDGERKVARGLTTLEELGRVVPPDEIDDTEVAAAPPRGRVVPLTITSSAPARTRIVIADEDPKWTERLAGVLREHFDVKVAHTREDVQAFVAARDVDLVVTELRGVPDLSGMDLLQHVRCADAAHDIGVFFLTTSNDPNAEVRALDLGADDYLRAPVNPELLTSRIRRTLQRLERLAS